MSGDTRSSTTEAPIPAFGEVLGHPRPLWMLFMTEFWERFAFYGIRWALVLYIVAQFHAGSPSGEEPASRTYGAYLALVYAAAIFGGYVADKILGYQRSILLGAVIMAAGLFAIAVPDARIFEFGLATIIVGNGLFKPNISTMVGKLYTQADQRRDSGFTIFYMGINAGAFLAPILTGWLAEQVFGTAGHAGLQVRLHRRRRRHAGQPGVVLVRPRRSCRASALPIAGRESMTAVGLRGRRLRAGHSGDLGPAGAAGRDDAAVRADGDVRRAVRAAAGRGRPERSRWRATRRSRC